jgi:gliding motility-associated peptidyl-prolyl isomerase
MLINCAENRPLRLTALLLVCVMAMVSCECSSAREPVKEQETQATIRDNIQAQKDFLEKERESIDAYIKDRDLAMQRSGTGLYYQLLIDSAAGKMVEPGDVVDFEYEIYLMNGTLIYTSEEDGVRTLKVDKEQAELGVHESLKLLGLGDKGRFILPSHLAFGVGGDQERVPPKTPLVYELKVININKSKS